MGNIIKEREKIHVRIVADILEKGAWSSLGSANTAPVKGRAQLVRVYWQGQLEPPWLVPMRPTRKLVVSLDTNRTQNNGQPCPLQSESELARVSS